MVEGWLEVLEEKSGKKLSVEELLNVFSQKDKTVWSKYLVYRDLRARGYVVKPGFGGGVDFRVYERGTYGKEAAKFLICNVFEGEPVSIKNLADILKIAGNMKKEVIIGVIERRGEVVYYSLSKFNL
ncbi:tRNA-intron lyase [Candidatus Bathyarchaeota archaeon]|nr:MAG: tRNA-intron lyase [Candidatus Bathyarchaeota archaeon]